jgi:hypothetical protein
MDGWMDGGTEGGEGCREVGREGGRRERGTEGERERGRESDRHRQRDAASTGVTAGPGPADPDTNILFGRWLVTVRARPAGPGPWCQCVVP